MSPIFQLAVVFSAIDKMTGPARKMFGSLKNYEQTIEKGKGLVTYGNQLSVAGAMTQGAADKMIGALKSISAPAIEVSDALAKLEPVTVSTMGRIQRSMNAEKKAAISWSKIHSDTAAQFINTTYMMASAGLNDIQSIEGTRTALTVAKATMGDATEAASLLATTYNNMGDKTKNVRKEMTRLGDIITKTQQFYQIKNLDQLSQGLSYAIPSAKQYGSTIEEVAAIMGMLNSAGLQGSMAGTAYTATMRQMIKASKDLGFALGRNENGGISLIKTVENIRKKYGDFNKMSDSTKMKFQQAFGDEGLRAIALLLGKTEEMNKALVTVTNSAGAAAAAQKTIELKSDTAQYQILQNNIDAIKIALAKNLLPSINQMMPSIIKLVNWFGKFVEKHPGLAKLVLSSLALGAAILAIVAPVMSVAGGFLTMAGYGIQGVGKIAQGVMFLQKLIVSGKLFNGIKMIGALGRTAFSALARALIPAIQATWSFTAALLANPTTWIVIGIIALIVAIVLLAKNWKKVSAWLGSAWAWVVNGFKKLIAWFKTSPFGKVVLGLLVAFMPFIGIPLLIATYWKQIVPIASKVWNGVVMVFQAAIKWIKGLPWLTIGLVILTAFLPFIGIPILIVRNWGRIKTFFGGLGSWIREMFAGLVQMALNWGRNLLGMFIKGITEKVKHLKEALRGAATKIKNFLGFHSPTKEGPGSTAHRWAPNLMNMYQSGIVSGTPGIKRAAVAAALSLSMALAQASSPSILNPSAMFERKPGQVAFVRLSKPDPDSPGSIRRQHPDPPDGKRMVVNFNGPVTIKADNPDDLWQQLKSLAEEAGFDEA